MVRTIPAAAAACLILSLAMSDSPKPVRTRSGLVSGVAGQNPAITVFKGIPFAAPPIGPLRWRAPMPARPWQGIRAADAFSLNCIQTIVTDKKPWTYEFMAHGEVSEDLLLKEKKFEGLRRKLLRGAADFYGKLEGLLQGQPDPKSRAALAGSYVELADLTDTPAPTLRGLAAASTLLAASLGLS